MNMENFVNKLRNTISSTASVTASSINAVLPGNLVTREYEVTSHCCSIGLGLGWKVFDAIKRSTKEEASVLVFEKRQLDHLKRKDRDLILDTMRKGVSQLTRLRHPSLLVVQHSLEESRDSLAFATEPIAASLANLLGHHHNVPTPIPKEIEESEFFELEIKYGLLSISEGLTFVHSAKMLHRNLSPESIIITKRGSWKIGGFEFASSAINQNDFPLKFPALTLDPDLDKMGLPNPDFMAPELMCTTNVTTNGADGNDPLPITLAADMFSLGCLTYILFNKGRGLFKSALGSPSFNPTDRKDQLKNMPSSAWTCIPEDSRYHIQNLLKPDAELRPDAHQFHGLSIFEDVLIRSLQYLDSSFQWDNLEKSKFYKGLPEVLDRMPMRVKLNRALPCLIRELMHPAMVPFVLPNLLRVGGDLSENDFKDHLAMKLSSVFEMMDPIQIPMLLVQQTPLFITKTKNVLPSFLQTQVLGLLIKCLEHDAVNTTNNQSIQLHQLVLATIPSVCPLLESMSLKKGLLPKVKSLCIKGGHLAVKVNCLVTIGLMMDHMDKWTVLDEVIPFLTQMTSREPAMIMASVGIIQLAATRTQLGLTKEVMANTIIPFLIPITIENGLSTPQFNTIMSLIKDLLSRVEQEQRVKIQQLTELKESQSMAVMSYSSSGAESLPKSSSLQSFSLNPNHRSSSSKPMDMTSKSNITSTVAPKLIQLPSPSSGTAPSSSSISIKPLMLESTAPIRPSSVRPMGQSVPSKDLTSTLMSNNLSQMGMSSSSINNQRSFPAIIPAHQPMMGPGGGGISGGGTGGFNSLNMSNLMGSTPKVPMNQMNRLPASQQQQVPPGSTGMMMPLMPSSSTGASTNGHRTNQLSKSDLEEFLK